MASAAKSAIRSVMIRIRVCGRAGPSAILPLFPKQIADATYCLDTDGQIEWGKATAQARNRQLHRIGGDVAAEFGELAFDRLFGNDPPGIAKQQLQNGSFTRRHCERFARYRDAAACWIEGQDTEDNEF